MQFRQLTQQHFYCQRKNALALYFLCNVVHDMCGIKNSGTLQLHFSVASSNISNEQFNLIFIDIFMAISQDKNNFDMEISLEVINI